MEEAKRGKRVTTDHDLVSLIMQAKDKIVFRRDLR